MPGFISWAGMALIWRSIPPDEQSMSPPRICVLVPVYNHGLTILEVARGARARFPVVVVDDGSTDETPRLLAQEPGIELCTHAENRGKAAALQTGMRCAAERGFTHVITIDADGQHPVAALAEFSAAAMRNPEALIVGVRDFKIAGAPWRRRIPNGLSNFCFWLETGTWLGDTQCGYRVYPLRRLPEFQCRAGGYGYELEIMVKAAWAGVRLVALPVASDYSAPTSRMSHFHPFRDLWRVTRLHLQLMAQAPVKRLAGPA